MPKAANDYTSRRYLERTLGHKVSDLEFEFFTKDTGKKGYTLPFYNYEGPGNSLQSGEPVNKSDRFAQIHDTQYFDTQWRYNEGEITQKEAKDEIFEEDQAAVRGFISSINEEPLGGALGAAGLLIKDGFEGIFGTQYPDFPSEPEPHTSHMERTPTKGGPHEAEGQPHTKKPKIADTPSKSGAVQPAALPENVNLPIDADMGLTGTGAEQASGGASSEGTPMYKTIAPYTDFGAKTSTYTKSFKFMTFGLAPNILTIDGVTGGRVLSSFMAELPWHIPALYLNQSEFDLLPDGAHCLSVSAELVYRGSTIQFETAATATGLATLNQINDIAFAHGLNRSGLGQNMRYDSFSDTQPMLPTSVIAPTYGPLVGLYRGMVRDYYGSNNDAATFESDIPKHQIGRHTFLYNYWVNTLRGGAATVANNMQFGGWPCLASAVQQMDGKTCVNQKITASTYTPKLAPLKAPLKMYGHGLPFPLPGGSLPVPVGGNLVLPRSAAYTASTAVPTTSVPISATITESTQIVGNTNGGTNTDPAFNIFSPIEKCQMGRTGWWGNLEPHIQPSFHFGVQPVPALTTSATLLEDGAFNKWTDTRAYWEVVTKMVVVDKAPTSWPYATKPNVPAGDCVVWQPNANRPAVIQNPRQDGATFQGLYSTTYTTI